LIEVTIVVSLEHKLALIYHNVKVDSHNTKSVTQI